MLSTTSVSNQTTRLDLLLPQQLKHPRLPCAGPSTMVDLTTFHIPSNYIGNNNRYFAFNKQSSLHKFDNDNPHYQLTFKTE